MDKDELTQALREHCRNLEETFDRLSSGEPDPEVYNPVDDKGEAVSDELYELPLEVVTDTIIVFTTGGPHIEFSCRNREFRGYWGSARVAWDVDRRIAEFIEDAYNLEE